MLKNGLSDGGYRNVCEGLVGNFNTIESRSILPTILSCIVDMKTKINSQKQKNNICR